MERLKLIIKWFPSAEVKSKEPTFYAGHFAIDNMNQVTDTYISFRGWGKGIAFVNEFNIGRYWPVNNIFVLIHYLSHLII